MALISALFFGYHVYVHYKALSLSHQPGVLERTHQATKFTTFASDLTTFYDGVSVLSTTSTIVAHDDATTMTTSPVSSTPPLCTITNWDAIVNIKGVYWAFSGRNIFMIYPGNDTVYYRTLDDCWKNISLSMFNAVVYTPKNNGTLFVFGGTEYWEFSTICGSQSPQMASGSLSSLGLWQKTTRIDAAFIWEQKIYVIHGMNYWTLNLTSDHTIQQNSIKHIGLIKNSTDAAFYHTGVERFYLVRGNVLFNVTVNNNGNLEESPAVSQDRTLTVTKHIFQCDT